MVLSGTSALKDANVDFTRRWSAARRKCGTRCAAYALKPTLVSLTCRSRAHGSKPSAHPQEPGTVPAGSFSTCAAISPGWVSQISSR